MKAVKELSKKRKFNHVMVLGDLIECVFNERGLLTAKDLEVAEGLKDVLIYELASKEAVSILPGDHELGYILPLSIDPNGGMSKASCTNFMERVGNIFNHYTLDYFPTGKFHFVVICSSLLCQNLKLLFRNDSEWLEGLKEQQNDFLVRVLKEVWEEDHVFIFLHDPDGLEELDKIVAQNCDYKNLRIKVFCGHFHSEETLAKYERLGKIANADSSSLKIKRWLFRRFEKGRKIMAWAERNPARMKLIKKYDVQIVPGLNGMLGSGKGALILNLFDDGGYEIEKHNF